MKGWTNACCALSVDEEISIGDYVLSGGELPAMVLIDAVDPADCPAYLAMPNRRYEDSFVDGLLDCPHYTRPEVYQGAKVPDVLMSGHHAEIRRWRLKQALERTWLRRPDLLAHRVLSAEEIANYSRKFPERSNAVSRMFYKYKGSQT